MSFTFQIIKKVDPKNCIAVTLGDLRKNQNWFIYGTVHEKPRKKKLQSPGGSKILLRIGHVYLSSLFLLIIPKYRLQQYTYKVSYDNLINFGSWGYKT